MSLNIPGEWHLTRVHSSTLIRSNWTSGAAFLHGNTTRRKASPFSQLLGNVSELAAARWPPDHLLLPRFESVRPLVGGGWRRTVFPNPHLYCYVTFDLLRPCWWTEAPWLLSQIHWQIRTGCSLQRSCEGKKTVGRAKKTSRELWSNIVVSYHLERKRLCVFKQVKSPCNSPWEFTPPLTVSAGSWKVNKWNYRRFTRGLTTAWSQPNASFYCKPGGAVTLEAVKKCCGISHALFISLSRFHFESEIGASVSQLQV